MPLVPDEPLVPLLPGAPPLPDALSAYDAVNAKFAYDELKTETPEGKVADPVIVPSAVVCIIRLLPLTYISSKSEPAAFRCVK